MTSFTLNGQATTLQADPTTPILWALRDNLGLVGTKFGCGMAQCSACTVLLNGQPVRACVTPLSAASGATLVTIEAVANDRIGKAVQDAWVKADVVQATLVGKGKDARPRLTQVTAGVHCNLCVNPRTVEAQVQGSVIMALGTTMPQHAITLRDGVVQQGNFHQYPMPRIADAPARIDVHIVPSAEPPKGMGEPGLPPLAPAYANAIARLTGKRLRELPFVLA